MSETTNHLKAKYLQCLGLSPSSTIEEIKASYKRLALLCHPDKNKSDEAASRFQELAKAYHKLTTQHDNEDEDINAEEIFLSVFGPMFGMGVHVCPHHGPFFCSQGGVSQNTHNHGCHSHQHAIHGLNGVHHHPEDWEIDSSDEGSYDSEEEYATEEDDIRPPDRPPRPILTARSSNSLRIEWGVPCDNGSPILWYILEMEQGDVPSCNSKQIYKGSKPYYLVKNLPSDTTHHFLVKAVNGVGASGFSPLASFRTDKGPTQSEIKLEDNKKTQTKKPPSTNNNKQPQKQHIDDTKTKKKKKKSQTKRKKERLRKLEQSSKIELEHFETEHVSDDTNIEQSTEEYESSEEQLIVASDEETFSDDENLPLEDDEEDYEMDVSETYSVYLFDLPWFTTISAIKQFFAPLRIPKTGIILHNSESGPSNRVPIDAYVTFALEEHAKQALEKDGEYMAFTKTQIQVSVRPVSRMQFDEILDTPNNAAQSIRKVAPQNDPSSPPRSLSCSLWIGNVSSKVTEDDLRDLFAPFGNIQSLRLLNRTNCAFVNYSSPQEAAAAKRALQGALIGDMNVEMKFSKPPKSQREGYNGNASNPSEAPFAHSRQPVVPPRQQTRSLPPANASDSTTDPPPDLTKHSVTSPIETSKDSDNNSLLPVKEEALPIPETDTPTLLDDMFPWVQGNLAGLSLEEDTISGSSGQVSMNIGLDTNLQSNQQGQGNNFSHLQTAFSYSLPAVDSFHLFSGINNTSYSNSSFAAQPNTTPQQPFFSVLTSGFFSQTESYTLHPQTTLNADLNNKTSESMWWQLPVNTPSGL
eukprot:CAMPEP_0168557912 /NCGR_PEP_ID=MMETSP0413-20121227/9683_1 /TAXON_ID=136452 /ORGANISM="Filamoeba nolandi, Strain NC-AS-23-1" /LENGTH=806 /DNA_ID=CAMNT_0008588985 /DNA_START=138 /DNA_END=2558 /DNA_ORIENTATION=+